MKSGHILAFVLTKPGKLLFAAFEKFEISFKCQRDISFWTLLLLPNQKWADEDLSWLTLTLSSSLSLLSAWSSSWSRWSMLSGCLVGVVVCADPAVTKLLTLKDHFHSFLKDHMHSFSANIWIKITFLNLFYSATKHMLNGAWPREIVSEHICWFYPAHTLLYSDQSKVWSYFWRLQL